MPRRLRVTALVIPTLGWASGLVLAGFLAQQPGGGDALWSAWSRPARAQQPGEALRPDEWQSLVGPLPYRPADPDNGWLSENDLKRAVDLIAGLGRFFAKLAETDPNARARQVWSRSEAAYRGAAEDLGARIEDGDFRIVVSEGSSLAIIRRGEEIWVDSDLAGAWDVERVRRARRTGDDWSDVAILSGLLFDLWRARPTAAGDAWMDQQRKAIDLPQGSAAAGLLTRYAFLKDLFLEASLLRAATADSANAALWRDRAQSIQDQVTTLLKSSAPAGPGRELAEALRDDWAAYGTQIEQSSADRAWLVLAAPRSAATPARPAEAPPQPTPQEAAGEQPAPREPTFEMIVPAGETNAGAESDALRARLADLETARRRDRDYIALLLARTAAAARAADEAQAALAAAQSGQKDDAEALAALHRHAEDLAADLDRSRGDQAALERHLSDAEDRATAAEVEAARLRDQLATAQSGSESAAAETDRLKQEAERLTADLDQARGDQAALERQLSDAEDRATAAEVEAARLRDQLTTAQSGSESAAVETDRLKQEAERLTADLDQARDNRAALERQLSDAEDRATAADADAARLRDQLTAARSGSASDAETMAALRRQSEGLSADLDQARSDRAALEQRLSDAEDRATAAEEQAARLAAQATAVQSATRGAAEETDRLRRQAEDLATKLDQSRRDRAALKQELSDTRDRATAAEKDAADLTAQVKAAQAATESDAQQLADVRRQAEQGAAALDRARMANTDLQAQLVEAQGRADRAEASLAKAVADGAAETADLKQQLAARDADANRLEAEAADRTKALEDAKAAIARLENERDSLQAAAANAQADRTALTAAESERAALAAKLAQAQSALASARQQDEAQSAALDKAQQQAAELSDALGEARRDLAAARQRADAETTRADQAEAAAAEAGGRAEDAERALAARQDELAGLRRELETLREETSSAQPGEQPPAGPEARLAAWWTPVLAVALLLGGLLALWAVLRRRPRPPPSGPEVPEAEATGPAERPAEAARPSDAPAAPKPEGAPAPPPQAPAVAARPPAAPAVTSATIVEAVRRQDWAAAEAQFARLAGASVPPLADLLNDPSGESLALACRAAHLDRLTFAALYLLQGQGRAVADPEVVAGAVSLFERTEPAEAQHLLAERHAGQSLSARGF